jgi:putative oxidoreductase
MFFGKLGIPLPGLLAPLVAVVEFVGGLGLILGLGTRFWSAGHAIIMIVAILKAKGLSTFKGFELEFLLLGASLGLFLMGPGAYSLDDRILKKIEKKEAEQKKPQALS